MARARAYRKSVTKAYAQAQRLLSVVSILVLRLEFRRREFSAAMRGSSADPEALLEFRNGYDFVQEALGRLKYIVIDLDRVCKDLKHGSVESYVALAGGQLADKLRSADTPDWVIDTVGVWFNDSELIKQLQHHLQ